MILPPLPLPETEFFIQVTQEEAEVRVQKPIGRRLVLGAAVAMIMTTAAQQPANAAPADPVVAADQHCVVVLDKLRPGQTASRILSRTCADRAHASALHEAAAASTLLLVLYEHANYGGASTRITGAYGACDAEGYGISALVSSWRNRVSSFKGFNYCNVVELFDGVNYAQSLMVSGAAGSRLDEPWVGSYANDKADSILVFRQG